MKWTIWAFLFSSLAFAESIPPVDCGRDNLSCSVAKLESKRLPLFYGTAILFEVEPTHFWFMTSAHLMPRSRANRNSLTLRTPLLGYDETPLEVVGEARGMDIAVFKVRRSSRDEYATGRFKVPPANAFANATWREGSTKLALFGIPGMPELYNEVRPGRHDKLWTNPADGLTSLREIAKCPPPFLDRCLLVPLLSWGFSGGALLASRAGITKIVGMVSHFAPLAGQTYAIPIDVAVDSAKEIKRVGRDLVYDPTGYFRLRPDSGVEILKGQQRGKLVKGAGLHPFAEGGDESSGGGDESSGGGDESSGGGPESSTDAVRNAKGNIARLGDFDSIARALAGPENWARRSDPLGSLLPYFYPFKGLRALLQHEPGVIFDGERIYGWGPTSVGTLQQFLLAYRKNDRAVPRSKPLPFAPPRRLRTGGNELPGFYSIGSIRRFKTVNQLRAMNGNFTRNDVGFELKNEIGPLIARHAQGGIDLLIGQVAPQGHYGTLPASTLDTADAETTVELSGSSGDRVTLTFPERWTQVGDRFLRYTGQFRARWFGESERTVRGFLSLQLDGAYEFRGFWAYSEPETAQEPGGFLSLDHIHLRAVSANFAAE